MLQISKNKCFHCCLLFYLLPFRCAPKSNFVMCPLINQSRRKDISNLGIDFISATGAQKCFFLFNKKTGEFMFIKHN